MEDILNIFEAHRLRFSLPALREAGEPEDEEDDDEEFDPTAYLYPKDARVLQYDQDGIRVWANIRPLKPYQISTLLQCGLDLGEGGCGCCGGRARWGRRTLWWARRHYRPFNKYVEDLWEIATAYDRGEDDDQEYDEYGRPLPTFEITKDW